MLLYDYPCKWQHQIFGMETCQNSASELGMATGGFRTSRPHPNPTPFIKNNSHSRPDQLLFISIYIYIYFINNKIIIFFITYFIKSFYYYLYIKNNKIKLILNFKFNLILKLILYIIRAGWGNTRTRPGFKKKISYPSQTRLLNLNPVPL